MKEEYIIKLLLSLIHRTTLQRYNYALLSSCLCLFNDVRVIRIYGTICDRQSIQLLLLR